MLARVFALFAVLAFAAPAAVTPATADAGVRVGVLTCDLDGGIGLIVGSRKSMTCFFNGNAEPNETYLGLARTFWSAGSTSRST